MTLDLAALSHEPFCAGVLVLDEGRLVLTLSRDRPAGDLPEPVLRVGGVVGAQERGESVWDCAYREATEQLGAPVQLLPASATWLVDSEEGEPQRIETGEGIAPLLVQRAERPNPDVAAEDGLPTGPYLYSVVFLATAEGELRAGDVEGLLLLPPEPLPLLDGTPTVADVEAAGGEVRAREPVVPETRLWLHPNDDVRLAARLLRELP